ncbi:MAG: hypothetical protein RJA61_106 [Candidatus Parcubacteria bacterium]|jgi:PTH1 family peptidyl-tRNA hydrolase
MAYIIAGLGNPGEEYKNTRHNAGRMVLEAFHVKNELEDWKENKKSLALISKGMVGKQKVTLVMPETFMNKSGESVKTLVKSVKVAEKLIVVHDDLDLPVGTLKVSFNRSSGGHKGVESIIKAIKTEKFARIRIGISQESAKGGVKKPSHENIIENFIVNDFKPAELAEVKKVVKRASEAVEMIVNEGIEKAMGEFNRR